VFIQRVGEGKKIVANTAAADSLHNLERGVTSIRVDLVDEVLCSVKKQGV
jgi:hypothetical protein